MPRRRLRSRYRLLRTGLRSVAVILELHWILRSVQPPRPLSAWDADGVRLFECGPAQAAWLAQAAPERQPIFAGRFAQGWRCFAATIGGATSACAGYLWLAVGPGDVTSPGSHFTWRLPAGAAWAADAWAHPLALGLYPDLKQFASGRLWEEGVRAYWSCVEHDNRVSRRLHKALGAVELGWVVSVGWGRWRLHCDRRRGAFRLRRSHTPVPLAAFLAQQPADLGSAAIARPIPGKDAA